MGLTAPLHSTCASSSCMHVHIPRRAARGGYEVLNADGIGTRGGDWTFGIRRLQVSDREDINKPADHRGMRWGGRLVRSVDR